MDVEKRVEKAITITRAILNQITADPEAIVNMAYYELTPGDLEDQVNDILQYLEMTKPEEPKEDKK